MGKYALFFAHARSALEEASRSDWSACSARAANIRAKIVELGPVVAGARLASEQSTGPAAAK